MTDSARLLEPIEGKSATLFLVAGGLLLVFAANTAARVFAGAGLPAVHSFVGPAGFFIGLLGLFGLYPGLAGGGSVLPRVTVLIALIPLVGWFVITTFGLGNTLGLLPAVSVILPGATVIVVFLSTMLSYLLVGATSLSVGAYSRTVGLVLLVPAVPFLTLILVVQAIPPVEWGEFVIDSGHALAHLAVGIALWSRRPTAARPASAPDEMA